MNTTAKHVESNWQVKRYRVQYPISDYTFPHDARIERVRFNNDYMTVLLTDGRVLSIPLQWIPTLCKAPPGERKKYEINASRTMIVWDPAKCSINDEIRIQDYLGPCGQ